MAEQTRLTFISPKYHFKGRLSEDQEKRAIAIIQDHIATKPTARGLVGSLKAAGLKWRYQDMLSDVRRAWATEKSYSPSAYARANWWFGAVEKVRETIPGHHMKQAVEVWEDYRRRSEQARLSLEETQGLEDMGIFTDTPDILWEE